MTTLCSFLYAGEYESVEEAKADLEELKELHREKFVGTYDAALLTKNEEGKEERSMCVIASTHYRDNLLSEGTP